MRQAASVEEHPKGSGKHRVRARIKGTLRTIASRLSRAEAEELADAYQVERSEADLREGITLAQFGVGFLNRRERSGVRGIRNDRSYWKTRVDSDPIGNLPVATLERRDVVDWLDRQKGEHRTRVKALNLLRVALTEAVDRGLLSTNPALEVRVHKATAATSTDDLEGILTLAEQQTLLAVVPLRERPVVAFALFTGLRQAEQWWLTWDDVRGDRVLVRRSTGGLPTKSGKPRTVGLLAPALEAVAVMPRRRTPFVFAAKRGGRREEGKAPRGWKAWLEAAGIARHVRWHDLRHTCATSLLAGWWGRKWTLDEVCSLLGHSSTKVTERYARKLNETQLMAVRETPTLAFPQGNMGAPKLLTSQDNPSAFVKHRSSVQIRQSAPLLATHTGERRGNVREVTGAGAWSLALAAERFGLELRPDMAAALTAATGAP